jgi:beta-glucosidase
VINWESLKMKNTLGILTGKIRSKAGKSPCLTLSGLYLILLPLSAFGQPQINKDYLNPDFSVEQRVASLIGQMTLEEKVGQMFMGHIQAADAKQLAEQGLTGSCVGVMAPAEKIDELQKVAVEKSRLGIPLLFGCDIVHGYSTIFPIPLAEASTWNPTLIQQCATIAGKESASQGIRWTMSPMVDIARDPRWGRIAEGAGEDPYLGMAMAKAMVEGYQGPQLSPKSDLVACVKHFVGYGACEGGRDYDTTEISERTLREIYLPPFKAAVDAGAGTVMSAFNDLNGIPASANPFTIQDVLRREWGFKGFIRADADAVAELVNHGIAVDQEDAALKAVTAGLDMAFNPYHTYLAKLVRNGKVPLPLVDESVRRILRIKFELGLFENPYVDLDQAKTALRLPEYIQTARETARQSIVLLRNQAHVLPLGKTIKTIAVIGPLADDKADLLGCWHAHGMPRSVVTLLEGIKTKVSPATKILYSKGCGITNDSIAGFSNALMVARQADVIIMAVGESADMSGEMSSRSSLDIPGEQEELVRQVSQLGKPMVEVLMNGRPLSISWDAEHVPAILETWFLGTEAGDAIADVLFGDYNPSGKLPVTFPRTVGQVPMYYNHKNSGRPASKIRHTAKYQDLPWTPLYPFGFGLSYTTFEISGLTVQTDATAEDQFRVSVNIKNMGQRFGTETVQLYIRQQGTSVTRPVKQLEGFAKVALVPGESKKVNFTLTPFDLSFYDQKMQRVAEAGPLEIMVGDNSEDVITNTVEIEKSMALEPPRANSFGNL